MIAGGAAAPRRAAIIAISISRVPDSLRYV